MFSVQMLRLPPLQWTHSVNHELANNFKKILYTRRNTNGIVILVTSCIILYFQYLMTYAIPYIFIIATLNLVYI